MLPSEGGGFKIAAGVSSLPGEREAIKGRGAQKVATRKGWRGTGSATGGMGSRMPLLTLAGLVYLTSRYAISQKVGREALL